MREHLFIIFSCVVKGINLNARCYECIVTLQMVDFIYKVRVDAAYYCKM